MLLSAIYFARRWKLYRQSVRELSRLTDRQLADVGLKRSEILCVAWDASGR
jgi:uncharacterized protein YjiS (DUF1127 family)